MEDIFSSEKKTIMYSHRMPRTVMEDLADIAQFRDERRDTIVRKVLTAWAKKQIKKLEEGDD